MTAGGCSAKQAGERGIKETHLEMGLKYLHKIKVLFSTYTSPESTGSLSSFMHRSRMLWFTSGGAKNVTDCVVPNWRSLMAAVSR